MEDIGFDKLLLYSSLTASRVEESQKTRIHGKFQTCCLKRAAIQSHEPQLCNEAFADNCLVLNYRPMKAEFSSIPFRPTLVTNEQKIAGHCEAALEFIQIQESRCELFWFSRSAEQPCPYKRKNYGGNDG